MAPVLSDSSEEVRANAASNKRNGSAKSNGLLLNSEKASSSTLPSQILYWTLVVAAFAIIIGVLMIFVFEVGQCHLEDVDNCSCSLSDHGSFEMASFWGISHARLFQAALLQSSQIANRRQMRD